MLLVSWCMRNTKRIKLVLLVVMSFLFFFACKKDDFSTNPEHQLTFSTDTLSFDTLISTRLSSTLRMKVYNQNKESVLISSVDLDEGASSVFRINLNGRSGTTVKNLELNGNDSLWLFVDVNLPVGGVDLPFEINENLTFLTNGNRQKVVLNAWGQNAVFHRPVEGDTLILGHSETWDGNLPHVIYGALKIDSASTLNIQNGCKVYFHQGASLVLSAGCKLVATGSYTNPVIFQGDRLEEKYKEISGQWGGLVFKEGSGNHELTNVVVKGASSGIVGEGRGVAAGPQLTAKNVVVKHCLNYGLLGKNADWLFLNLGVYDCGADALRIEKGGKYRFYHATLFASVSSSAQGTNNHALTLQNWSFESSEVLVNDLEQFEMYNSIIWSNTSNAVNLSNEGATFNFQFNHCLLKTTSTSSPEYLDCIFNKSPAFVNENEIAILLGENSAAQNAGSESAVAAFSSDLNFDLRGESRLSDAAPDLGAYQFIPE